MASRTVFQMDQTASPDKGFLGMGSNLDGLLPKWWTY